jgi:acetyltransferase-like isoleucine patch superfamily enzyme
LQDLLLSAAGNSGIASGSHLYSAEANALAEFVRALIHLEILKGQFIYGPPERVHLAPGAAGNFLGNTISGHIHVGKNAFFGHYCMLLTGTHDVTKFGEEFQQSYPTAGRDIHLGEGAWLGSGVIVLGPCRIGKHAIVGAGSLVTHDIPDYAIAHGHPATVKGYRQPPVETPMIFPAGYRQLTVGETTAAGDLLLHIQPIMHWAALAPSHQGKAVGADWRPIFRLTASQEQPNAPAVAQKSPQAGGSEGGTSCQH